MSFKLISKKISESGFLHGDSESVRHKKSTLTIIAFPLGVAGIVWGMVYFFFGYTAPACIPFFFGVLTFVNLACFIIYKKFRFFRFTQILLILLLPFFLQITLGGFVLSSCVILWSIVSPIGASVFYSIKKSLNWFIAFLVLIIIAFFIDDFAREYCQYDISDNFIKGMFLMNLLGISCISFTIQYYFLNKQAGLKRIVRKRNKEISDSIMYAKNIQTAILPSVKLLNNLIPNHFMFYHPKDIVSGDFYWIERKENKVFVSVVDCTGHGVPGAFVSIIGHGCLNRAVNEFNLTKPSDILDKLNELVEDTFSKSEKEIRDGMDMALCCIDLKNNTLEFAGAYNSLYYIQDGILSEIKGDKQPIGHYFERKPFTNHTLTLDRVDWLFLFSDGYVDQFGGPDHKKFKKHAFKKILVDNQDKTPADLKRILIERYQNWRGNVDQIDDICILGLKPNNQI